MRGYSVGVVAVFGAILTFAADVAAAGATRWYVDGSASGSRNGQSWENAFDDLQDAMDAAHAGDSIWVAAGVYRPTVRTTADDPRTATFMLPDGVAIYGGFSGGEHNLEVRDWKTNETILSGDLAGDDTQTDISNCCMPHSGSGCDHASCELAVCEANPSCCTGEWNYSCTGLSLVVCDLCSAISNNGENSYHVVTALNVGPATLLDGFTITGGNADLVGSVHDAGGGVLHRFSSLSLNNCIVVRNSAHSLSGGFHNVSGSPSIRRTDFVNNYCSGNGGAFSTGGADDETGISHFVDCTFSANFAAGAGAVYVRGRGRSAFVRCSFDGNRSALAGGSASIASDAGAESYFVNCSFRANWAGAFGGALLSGEWGLLSMVNSVFTGNHAGQGGAVEDSGSLRMANCTVAGNSAGQGGGIHISSQSPVISNSIFWGNWDSGENLESAQIHAQSGAPLIDYSCVQGWGGAMGGEGNMGSDPMLLNITGVDNVIGTLDDDLRLRRGSPCIDAGRNDLVPEDMFDIDANGISREPLPVDYAERERFQDDPDTPDTGVGPAPIVDIGAMEFGFVDCNANGIADDLEIYAGAAEDCNGNIIPDECELPDCIISSDPPDGSIDARYPASTGGKLPESWSVVKVQFSNDPAPLSPGAFSVEMVPPGDAPTVESLEIDGLTVTLTLDRPIEPGAWTIITHRTSGTCTKVGFLPGDVNGDRTSSPIDILKLIDALNGVGDPLPQWSTDIDGSGESNAADILREIDILSNCDPIGCWLYATLPALE